MNLQLENKIALVTAASSGLGYATAMQLLHEGAKVAVCGRSIARLKKAYTKLESNKLALFETDLNSKEAVDRLIQDTATQFGGLDILITNIGGPPLTTFEDATDKNWIEANDSIVMSAIHLIQAALPYLRKSQSPCILTITSITSKQPLPGLILSNVYRPAVAGLTKTLSKEFGKYGIRANSILPGYTMTDRLKDGIDFKAKNNHISFEEVTKELAKDIPLGRIGNPQEFANVATFLVSPAASYVNGVMMVVDGGASESLF